MQSLNNYKNITTATTTTFAGTETNRVVLGAINVNKILTGTLQIKAGTVLIGIMVFKEPITLLRIFFLITLIASIIGLKAVSH